MPYITVVRIQVRVNKIICFIIDKNIVSVGLLLKNCN